MENKLNFNINNFATELSELIGKQIDLDNIYPTSTDWRDYMQAPKAGSPLLLLGYYGKFFVDIHPDDFNSILSGKVSAHDYITSANWQVGYYWHNGCMIGGSYHQPIDIIGRKDEVRRYLQILSCRGYGLRTYHKPSEEKCGDCFVEHCPFSNYKEGNWEAEMPEFDPRDSLFEALKARFEQENPGYTLGKEFFFCGKIPDEKIGLTPIARITEDMPLAFKVLVSRNVIQSLLLREVEPENWEDYAKSFQFFVHKPWGGQPYAVTKEELEKAYEGLDYTKETREQPEVVKKEKVSLFARVMTFFKRIF